MATATASAGLDLMLVPDVAAEAPAPGWAVRKVLDEMSIARRVGRVRVIDRADLPLVIEELDRRGYLDNRAPSHPGGALVERETAEMTQAARGAQSPDGPHGSVAVPAAPQPRRNPSGEGPDSDGHYC